VHHRNDLMHVQNRPGRKCYYWAKILSGDQTQGRVYGEAINQEAQH